MSVLINFKICDNSEDCSGIDVCPAKAFIWDEKNRTIRVNEQNCVLCGKCEDSCPVGAIRVARTDKEFRKIKREIEEDPRKTSDLFVDRYGAAPVHPAFLISEDKFDVQILRSTKPAVVELFNNDSIKCLLNSVPMRELFKGKDIKYRKMEVKDRKFLRKYEIKELPSLLFFRNGKIVGKIEGYYGISRKKKLTEKTTQILISKSD